MSFPLIKNEPVDSRTEQQGGRGGPIVHVRGDSETELDLLFSVLKGEASKQPGQTYRDKNLPLSFFNPPEPKQGGSHSREGSLDYTGAPGGQTLQQQLQATQAGLNVFHGRSHSSPATLPVSLSLPSGGQHLKQASGDLMADTTSKYFVNNATNAWQADQCKPHDGSVVGSQNKQSLGAGQGADLGTLPAGWEQGVTAEGDIYYINHNTKSTSWYDPRLPRHLQKPVALKVSQGQQAPLQLGQQQVQHGAISQQHNPLSQPNQLTKQQVQQATVQQANQQLSKQQFLQQQQQQQQNQLLLKQLPPGSQIRAPATMLPQLTQSQQQSLRNVSVQQIRLELQKLQKDKERLAREQEENALREKMLIQELMGHQASMMQTTGGQGDSLTSLVPASLMVPQAMQQMNISGVDPFLGQTVMGPDMHARQNSGDSGLGNCYSLPRTPEDFLGTIEDRHDINNIQKKQQQHHAQQQQQQQQVCDYGINPRQGSLSALDMTNLVDTSGDPMPMDSDELVSTLTDDLGLGRDFLDMQMMDILL